MKEIHNHKKKFSSSAEKPKREMNTDQKVSFGGMREKQSLQRDVCDKGTRSNAFRVREEKARE